MKGKTPSVFFSDSHPPLVTRFNFVWCLVIAFTDEDFSPACRYFVLENKQHTGWGDFSFFDVAVKNMRRPGHPVSDFGSYERHIRQHLAAKVLTKATIQESLLAFLWDRFRVSIDKHLLAFPSPLPYRDIIYQSPDEGEWTACRFQFVLPQLEVRDLAKIARHPEAHLFPAGELRATQDRRFSNQVQMFFEPSSYRHADALITAPGLVLADDVPTNATVLFSDMQDFSRLVLGAYDPFTDRAALPHFRQLCKQYQQALARPIRRNGGHVIQTAGDAVFAVFSGPPEDSARLALASCGALFRAADELRATTAFRALTSGFVTRVGLATGPILRGFLGPYELKEDTAFGRTVNVASRLEKAVKERGTNGGLVCDKTTRDAAFADAPTAAALAQAIEVNVAVKEILDEPLQCYYLDASTAARVLG